MRFYILMFLSILSISIHQVEAQKVALVLSGGGAKGLAHVGVIKALEQNGIPIDYIAGTSMGAIVGALYASGYSPEQMERLFKSKEFKLWSTGKIEPDKVYFFKRRKDSPAWIDVNLKPKSDKLQVVIPTNIIPEAQMDFAFMELFAGVNAVSNYNFDNLFIPFRCVATDVYNHSAVICKAGDLGEAVRASMTFPLYFKPIEINGVLLFDGGIVNNFPVDVAMKDFKPDIVIGHNVANNASKPDPEDIVSQLENMIMNKTDYTVPKNKGILLESKFKDVGLLDFQKIDSIEQKGYLTAIQNMKTIKKLIQRRITKSEIDKKREIFKNSIPRVLFHDIQVEGVTDNMKKKYIAESIKHNSPIVNINELRDGYYKLISDDQIRSIRPMAIYNKETGFFDLSLKAQSVAPLGVQIGGNVSSQGINEGFIGVNYKTFKDRAYTATGNIFFGKFYSSADCGLRIDFPNNQPFYLSTGVTFNSWNYYSSSSDLFFEDSRPLYLIKNERSMRINIGTPLSFNSMLEAGIGHSNSQDNYYQTNDFKKADTPDKTTFDAFNFHLKYEYQSQNNIQYPTTGTHQLFNMELVTGNEKYSPGTTSPETTEKSNAHSYIQARFLYDHYFPISSKFTFGGLLESVLSNKSLFSNYRASISEAPAFTPTSHSTTIFIDQFRANNYLAAGTKEIYSISENLHFRIEEYCFIPIKKIIEANNYYAEYDSTPFSNKYFMGTSALVYQTPIGPTSISVNYYQKNGPKFYFLFNFGYILFNRK